MTYYPVNNRPLFYGNAKSLNVSYINFLVDFPGDCFIAAMKYSEPRVQNRSV